jgi:GntR family transcriptional regulator/MocR family aminotransferase
VSKGQQVSPNARLAYVTPANQFPLGVAMSANRRIELLNWAVQAGAWLIEDEYDAEYRYSGKPLASLHSLDQSGSVIYVGTFTKMLFNAIRLGFMVVPERLVHTIEIARSFVDCHPATLEQAVLAQFITDGHFGHHVQKMRSIYSERLKILRDASADRLSEFLDIENAAAGIRTIGWLKHEGSDQQIAQRASHAGLEIVPLSSFAGQHKQRPGLVLGFAACDENELKRGVAVLHKLLASMPRPARPDSPMVFPPD